MAKKKSESAPKTKKAADSKPAAAAGDGGSLPQIDTSLAAVAAAKALAAGRGTMGAAAPASGESAAFKQLKAGLNKPTFGGATGNLLNSVPNTKKANTGFGGGKQTGRNQTFGADVNRTGVPRRTSGG